MTENTSVPRSFVLGMMTGIGMCWLLVAVIVEFTKPPRQWPPTVIISRYGHIEAGACKVQINTDGIGIDVYDCENAEVAEDLRKIGVGFSEDEIPSYAAKDIYIFNQKNTVFFEDYPRTSDDSR